MGGCRLWQDGVALETPEERDFLEALGVGWIEPRNREVGRFEGIVASKSVK